ncbi:hypothetical protein BJ165DRAFT_1530698 [Panaeolus papilionaceus]|nr:hypothetical protein BJ165DRAFT_1530698 [Panaeolus papilionaceus]
MSCRVWNSSLLMLAIITLLILDAVLILRIYALYQKRKDILWILVPISAQPICAGVSVHRLLFKESVSVDGLCDLEGSIVDSATLGSAIFFAHFVLWLATFARRNVANGQAAVVKLVVQESACALALLLAMIGATIPYAGLKHRVSPFFPLPWIISVQCITCCRLIMNMRRLNVEPSDQEYTGNRFVLSTVFDDVAIRTFNTTSDIECRTPSQDPPNLSCNNKPP